MKNLIANFKNLPLKSRQLMAVGTILALFVALPLFIFAVISPKGSFDIRNRAQEAPSPTPIVCPTPPPCSVPLIYGDPRPGSDSCPTYYCPVSPSPSLSPSPSTSPITCNPSDINKDGVTDTVDYSILISDFFKTQPINPSSDINHDGIVDITDYSLLVSNFLIQTGPCQ